MRTTIDLPDDLFRQVQARAASEGSDFKNLITHYVERGLRSAPPIPAPKRRRSPLPVARRATGQLLPSLTNGELQHILDEEEATGGRSD